MASKAFPPFSRIFIPISDASFFADTTDATIFLGCELLHPKRKIKKMNSSLIIFKFINLN